LGNPTIPAFIMNVFLKVCKYSLKVGKPQSLTTSKLSL